MSFQRGDSLNSEQSPNLLDIKRAEKSHLWKREENEHYVEEMWCSRRLFDVEQFQGEIIDPACGFGRIVESALLAGYSAGGADIVQRAPRYPIANFFAS